MKKILKLALFALLGISIGVTPLGAAESTVSFGEKAYGKTGVTWSRFNEAIDDLTALARQTQWRQPRGGRGSRDALRRRAHGDAIAILQWVYYRMSELGFENLSREELSRMVEGLELAIATADRTKLRKPNPQLAKERLKLVRAALARAGRRPRRKLEETAARTRAREQEELETQFAILRARQAEWLDQNPVDAESDLEDHRNQIWAFYEEIGPFRGFDGYDDHDLLLRAHLDVVQAEEARRSRTGGTGLATRPSSPIVHPSVLEEQKRREREEEEERLRMQRAQEEERRRLALEAAEHRREQEAQERLRVQQLQEQERQRLQEQQEAATRIQAAYRGHAVREEQERQRIQEEFARRAEEASRALEGLATHAVSEGRRLQQEEHQRQQEAVQRLAAMIADHNQKIAKTQRLRRGRNEALQVLIQGNIFYEGSGLLPQAEGFDQVDLSTEDISRLNAHIAKLESLLAEATGRIREKTVRRQRRLEERGAAATRIQAAFRGYATRLAFERAAAEAAAELDARNRAIFNQDADRVANLIADFEARTATLQVMDAYLEEFNGAVAELQATALRLGIDIDVALNRQIQAHRAAIAGKRRILVSQAEIGLATLPPAAPQVSLEGLVQPPAAVPTGTAEAAVEEMGQRMAAGTFSQADAVNLLKGIVLDARRPADDRIWIVRSILDRLVTMDDLEALSDPEAADAREALRRLRNTFDRQFKRAAHFRSKPRVLRKIDDRLDYLDSRIGSDIMMRSLTQGSSSFLGSMFAALDPAAIGLPDLAGGSMSELADL